MNKPSNIIVGMSGGVDSSVSAYLLKEAGHNVRGIFMKNWEGDDTDSFCPAEQDMADAQAVCDKLGIELSMVNFANEYWERVFAFFLDEYSAGRTPNPDILCNKEIKFSAFLDYARNAGADYIATGHYVRKSQSNQLLKGKDAGKDQSYFLYAIDADQIAQALFPVGELQKSEVREIAEKNGLITHNKKDSTGICFIGERKFKEFLNEYLPAQPGEMVTIDGEVIGEHDGLMFYTIGQRQGLKIGGIKDMPELPWYVADKDLETNRLIVVQGEHDALYKPTLICSQLHWINEAPALPLQCKAKTRYRQKDQECTLTALENGQYRADFAQPQRAITPGQSIVFYIDDICLGGGIIEG